MISFALIGVDGLPISGGRARDLPEGAIELRPPFTTLDLPRLRYQDGAWIEREQPLVLTPEEVAAEEAAMAAGLLSRARAQAVARINSRTGDFRKRIYTDIPGQDALYLEKRAEAVAYVRQATFGTEAETLEDYPLLANEVGITAPNAWSLAQLWLNRSEQFMRVGAETERARMQATIAIAAAPDFDTIEIIEATFNEALNGLSI